MEIRDFLMLFWWWFSRFVALDVWWSLTQMSRLPASQVAGDREAGPTGPSTLANLLMVGSEILLTHQLIVGRLNYPIICKVFLKYIPGGAGVTGDFEFTNMTSAGKSIMNESMYIFLFKNEGFSIVMLVFWGDIASWKGLPNFEVRVVSWPIVMSWMPSFAVPEHAWNWAMERVRGQMQLQHAPWQAGNKSVGTLGRLEVESIRSFV